MVIELKNAVGGYGKKMIVYDVSARFEKGSLTSIVGANGCGKSTLLMLCAGLLPLSSGKVLLDGRDITELSRNEVAKKIAYLGQTSGAGSLTVRALVSHGRFPYLGYPRRYGAADREKIEEAMTLAGVADLSDRMVNELSGGQYQRVRIAMMLAQDTDILLLDEPLTYLDISHQLELMALIVKLKKMGKTVVTVLHDLNLALTCSDKVAVMDGGRLVAVDSPERIVKSNSLEGALGVQAVYSEDVGQYFFRKTSE